MKIEIELTEDDYQKLLKMHTPEPFGQPADLHPDTLPKLIRTVSRFSFGHFWKIPAGIIK